MSSVMHYFNTGHVALPSASSRDALTSWLRLVTEIGSDSQAALKILESGDYSHLTRTQASNASELSAHWDGLEFLYERLAQLTNCDREMIVLLPTFLDSLLLTMQSLAELNSQTIFYTDLDHPNVVSGIRAFAHALGMTAQPIELEELILGGATPGEIEERLLASLRFVGHGILFVPHVDYRYGYCLDVAGIFSKLRANHALVVDAVHSIGKLDVGFAGNGIAIVLGSGHKWLGGWRASSFACCYGDKLRARRIASFWQNQTQIAFSSFDRLANRHRLADWGSVCEMPLISLGIGLRSVLEHGLEQIRLDTERLVGELNDALLDRDWTRPSRTSQARSGICFLAPKSPEFAITKYVERCRSRYALAISGYERPRAGIRICVSYRNSQDDMMVLKKALSILDEERLQIGSGRATRR